MALITSEKKAKWGFGGSKKEITIGRTAEKPKAEDKPKAETAKKAE